MRPGLGDELVQLGAVVLRRGRLAETFEELVDPERPIPAAATAVHGVTDEMAAGRPKASVLALILKPPLGDSSDPISASPPAPT